MFQNIGFTELLLIAVVALVLFGPQKLPEIGRVLGRTIRDFKKGAHALLNDEPEEAASKQAVQAKPAQQVSTQGETASTNSDATDAASTRAAVTFISSTPAVVETAEVRGTTAHVGAGADSTAAAEPEAVRIDDQPEQTLVAAPSASTATAEDAHSVSPAVPTAADAAPASTAGPAPTSTPKYVPTAPSSSTRRLPD